MGSGYIYIVLALKNQCFKDEMNVYIYLKNREKKRENLFTGKHEF